MLPGNTPHSGHCGPLLPPAWETYIAFHVPQENQNLHHARGHDRRSNKKKGTQSPSTPPCPSAWHHGKLAQTGQSFPLLPRLPFWRLPCQFCLKPAEVVACSSLRHKGQRRETLLPLLLALWGRECGMQQEIKLLGKVTPIPKQGNNHKAMPGTPFLTPHPNMPPTVQFLGAVKFFRMSS